MMPAKATWSTREP